MFDKQLTLAIPRVILAATLQPGIPGQSGTPGQPGRAGTSVTSVTSVIGSRIEADGPSASVTVVGGIEASGLALSADGDGPVKLILEHPPLSFIAAEIDLDITPAGELQYNQPLASDQVWIELGGVKFDQVAFTPQDLLPSDPGAPVVGTLVLSQESMPVYTLSNMHAGHYGGPTGGQFSVGLDAQTGFDYVAYGPAHLP